MGRECVKVPGLLVCQIIKILNIQGTRSLNKNMAMKIFYGNNPKKEKNKHH